MHPNQHLARRTLRSAFAAAAVISAVASGPAAADSGASTRPAIDHQTPKVPVMIDGVRYAPKQIHRFDGRPLYMRPSRDGKKLIATTNLSRFKSFLRKQGQRLPSRTGVNSGTAKASGLGHTMEFGDNAIQGARYQIDSGWGIPNFGVLSWYPWGNAIDWVYPHGQNGALFDWPDFNYYGPVFYVLANQRYDLSRYGWQNRVESLFQYW